MIRYVKKRWTSPLFRRSSGDDVRIDLLWGDRVRVLESASARWKVKARGITGFVNPDHLGTRSYLELYIIDVGQGDGVLIRTPDDRHVLIDGGWPRRSQPTGKNAADFVDWKFFRDYEKNAIELDAMICTHNDQDHYGGLWDMLDAAQDAELDVQSVAVDNFYHAGLSWWKGSSGRTLGPSTTTNKGSMWTRLLDDRSSLVDALGTSGTGPKLQGEWATFLSKIRHAKTRSGSPTPVTRLTHAHGYLPGFGADSDVTMNVLAPVEFGINGKPAIRKFSGGNSKNTNGNSVLLRLDYKSARILLTGDLNAASQQSLLTDYAGQHDEFTCDVAKACHHGSGDVSIRFLEAMKPTCTIISSGDSEGHDHPRPAIVAASGLTGYRTVKNDKLVTPLVYSTELARSIALGKVVKLQKLTANSQVINEFTGSQLRRFRTGYKVTVAGARAPKSGRSIINKRRIASKTTYGLINVRTDGTTIMCAALNEKDFKWNIETFKARF
jgi:beta-lactamase superfamily II metal-dependent hydrolase